MKMTSSLICDDDDDDDDDDEDDDDDDDDDDGGGAIPRQHDSVLEGTSTRSPQADKTTASLVVDGIAHVLPTLLQTFQA